MENSNGGKVPVSSQSQDNESGTKYTIPGVLHFIQHEWARFEMDRAHWDVEKAELQVRYLTYKLFRSLWWWFKCFVLLKICPFSFPFVFAVIPGGNHFKASFYWCKYSDLTKLRSSSYMCSVLTWCKVTSEELSELFVAEDKLNSLNFDASEKNVFIYLYCVEN